MMHAKAAGPAAPLLAGPGGDDKDAVRLSPPALHLQALAYRRLGDTAQAARLMALCLFHSSQAVHKAAGSAARGAAAGGETESQEVLACLPEVMFVANAVSRRLEGVQEKRRHLFRLESVARYVTAVCLPQLLVCLPSTTCLPASTTVCFQLLFALN